MAKIFSSPADTLVGGFNAVVSAFSVPAEDVATSFQLNNIIDNTTVLEPQGISSFNAVVSAFSVPVEDIPISHVKSVVDNTTVLEPQGPSSYDVVLPIFALANDGIVVPSGEGGGGGQPVAGQQVWIG